MSKTDKITAFHAHVYFGPGTVEQARALCEAARDRFGIKMGRVHEKPVGPHPDWSCQLTVPPEKFGAVMPWLALNRNGLNVFVHADTGDDLIDHTRHVMWLGESRPLDVSQFEEDD